MEKKSTGLFDTKGNEIFLYDILESSWEYSVVVCQDEKGQFYGKLICQKGHPCEKYSL